MLFSIFCLVAFTFPDTPVNLPTQVSENEQVGDQSRVCDQKMYECFYTSSQLFENYCDSLYAHLFTSENKPSRKVFNYAMKGYSYCLSKGYVVKKNVVSFIDYSLSSNKKRMWVIDLKQEKLLFHELVAHGRNTGNEYARKFSNVSNSYQSSLGFFITGEIYDGKHEMSVKLNGLERKYNTKALDRGIVIHGADYVSETYIQENQRLGRSLGCPAVSQQVISSIAETIADGTCLFSYYPNRTYLRYSKFVNTHSVYLKEVQLEEPTESEPLDQDSSSLAVQP